MAKQDAILKEKEQEREEKVIETVSKTDQFFRENKKTIYGILIALVVIALALVAYQKFYVQPKSDEATAQMIPAEANFRNGEYELALNGDGNVLGFAQIINDFGAKGRQGCIFLRRSLRAPARKLSGSHRLSQEVQRQGRDSLRPRHSVHR